MLVNGKRASVVPPDPETPQLSPKDRRLLAITLLICLAIFVAIEWFLGGRP